VPTIEELLAEFQALLGRDGTSATEPRPADPAAEIAAANQRLRDTAKWLLTSFAAVGAIIVAGLQLSSIGKLTSESPQARIWATLLGIAVAAIGVAIAIGFMSSVLAPHLNSFRSADENTDAADRALEEPLGMTYEQLKTKISERDAAVTKARQEHGTNSSEYRTALAARDKWEPTRRDALTLIGAELLWDRYKTARIAVIIAIFLVLGGVVAFAWGANPPDEAKQKPQVALGQAPLLLKVTLTPAGVAALKDARGCTHKTFQVLSISGTIDKREVVTVPRAGCKPVRFVLTAELGTAVAATTA
jgi:hypothetical protein